MSDFTWSHDGAQALISYRDGFVLVGSVSGQRHWSSEINLESQITCGIWTPDDQQVTRTPSTFPSLGGVGLSLTLSRCVRVLLLVFLWAVERFTLWCCDAVGSVWRSQVYL